MLCIPPISEEISCRETFPSDFNELLMGYILAQSKGHLFIYSCSYILLRDKTLF